MTDDLRVDLLNLPKIEAIKKIEDILSTQFQTPINIVTKELTNNPTFISQVELQTVETVRVNFEAKLQQEVIVAYELRESKFIAVLQENILTATLIEKEEQ